MKNYGLVHPRMLDELTPNFYPSLCTIYDPGIAPPKNEYGESIGLPQPVTGLVNLACRIAPKSANEARQPNQIYATTTHHIALAGCYRDAFGEPLIGARMVAEVDGVRYAIEGYEDDGNDKTSRIYVRQVKN